MSNYECEYCDFSSDTERGVKVHVGIKHPIKLPYNDPAELERLYWEEELSAYEIAEKWDCEPMRVMGKMKKFNIEKRDSSERIENWHDKFIRVSKHDQNPQRD